jgi:hypothetical protein
MSAIDRAIEQETHLAYMARMGLYPENLIRHEQRIKDLQEERARQRQQYLDAADILDRMTAPKGEPSCLRPLGADEHFDGRGRLRQEKPSPFHH